MGGGDVASKTEVLDAFHTAGHWVGTAANAGIGGPARRVQLHGERTAFTDQRVPSLLVQCSATPRDGIVLYVSPYTRCPRKVPL